MCELVLSSFSFADFSAQLWCEKQLEFILVTGK